MIINIVIVISCDVVERTWQDIKG